MSKVLLPLCLLLLLITVIFMTLGVINGKLTYPILGWKIEIMHFFLASVLAIGLLTLIKNQDVKK